MRRLQASVPIPLFRSRGQEEDGTGRSRRGEKSFPSVGSHSLGVPEKRKQSQKVGERARLNWARLNTVAPRYVRDWGKKKWAAKEQRQPGEWRSAEGGPEKRISELNL